MTQQVQSQLAAVGLQEEKAYFTARYSVKGLQYGCLAATPLYVIQAIRRGGGSLRGLLRYNWTVPLLGGGAGAVAGYTHGATLDHPSLAARTSCLRLDADRVRSDDLHLIGGVIGALLLPAIFLRRVGLINGLLGGAGLGGAAGLITHQVQKLQNNPNKLQNDIQAAKDKVKAETDKVADKLE